MDFEKFLKNNNSIVFLDPPYYLESKSKLYGNNSDLHEHLIILNYINVYQIKIIG